MFIFWVKRIQIEANIDDYYCLSLVAFLFVLKLHVVCVKLPSVYENYIKLVKVTWYVVNGRYFIKKQQQTHTYKHIQPQLVSKLTILYPNASVSLKEYADVYVRLDLQSIYVKV